MKPTSLRSHERTDDGNAFLPDTVGTGRGLHGADAQFFAEEFVASALTGESLNEDTRDEVVADEEGGPFLVLGEDGQLPPEPQDEDLSELEDDTLGGLEQARGSRWAARGV